MKSRPEAVKTGMTNLEVMQRAGVSGELATVMMKRQIRHSGAHTQKVWNREQLPVRRGGRKQSNRTTKNELHGHIQGNN